MTDRHQSVEPSVLPRTDSTQFHSEITLDPDATSEFLACIEGTMPTKHRVRQADRQRC